MASHERRPITYVQKIWMTGSVVAGGQCYSSLVSVCSHGAPKLRRESTVCRGLTLALHDLPFFRAHGWPLSRTIALSVLKSLRGLVKSPVSLSLSPTTGERIRAWCKQNNRPLSSHTIHCQSTPDATLHEIVLAKTAPGAPVLYYLHGGGYRRTISHLGHIPLACSIGEELGVSSVFLLEYGLTPAQTYPVQLHQAAAGLAKLLQDLQIAPSKIVVAGDSAGGHLALSLLAHLIETCPSVPAVPEMSGQTLKGVLLMSPWVTMTYNTPSAIDNDRVDMVSIETMEYFTQQLAPRPEVWADMLQGSAPFWGRIPVDAVLVTVGGLEVFRDDVLAMFKLLEAAKMNGASVQLVYAANEVHVQAGLDIALGLERNKTTKGILGWCRSLSSV